ncbi:MAG: DnaA regulatory inactivator Hda [Lysobacteraceae bacterium]|nr:MAG: DnaA regulatory inactivator Hda [Xanthomonadaceae bacterium]
MAAAQLPLALRYPPDQRFDTYVDADDHVLPQLRALARAHAGALPLDALYLSGPAATGKTHLLLAACADAEACGRRAAYLPLTAATGMLRAALESFEHADLLALDGLEAIVGDRDDQIALFDAHNRARDAGRNLLYAGRAMPDALDLDLPDLRSRLAQCVRIALAPLDDIDRAEALRLRAQRRGLHLDEAAIDWLLRRVDRDMPNLTALLDRLDRESLAAQRRITVPFLRRVLG